MSGWRYDECKSSILSTKPPSHYWVRRVADEWECQDTEKALGHYKGFEAKEKLLEW